MIVNLPNPKCCNTNDVRHLCDKCAAIYNAAHQDYIYVPAKQFQQQQQQQAPAPVQQQYQQQQAPAPVAAAYTPQPQQQQQYQQPPAPVANWSNEEPLLSPVYNYGPTSQPESPTVNAIADDVPLMPMTAASFGFKS